MVLRHFQLSVFSNLSSHFHLSSSLSLFSSSLSISVLWWLLLFEWLYYSKRIIIVRWADLSEFFFSLIFVCKMCVFVSRQMKIVTFHLKNDYSQNGFVDFPLERDTFRNKIMEIVEDFDEKKKQQQR